MHCKMFGRHILLNSNAWVDKLRLTECMNISTRILSFPHGYANHGCDTIVLLECMEC